ncbi:hypothetical protein SAMN02745136_04936 [Anaerocolumna jejuensis DSM 15929]|uniref:Uncharacterized protein n=1 Tax=Anaerocolumna jejuensis DSM 15929 TaxID=1121322 RepID=A0A1M7ARE1_9FIRM|nr:hypothetical protein [Anaerocolumna jejuensis]SHL45245.1 hypothetical protein SAMN02745136_04936 [Anaerocolumna jejuensis DSM 15929]
MLFNYDESEVYKVISERRTAANVIEINTIQECLVRKSEHSWQRIVETNRKPALACRMTSKSLDANGKSYNANDIVNIFITSCERFGFTYYPIKCNIENFRDKLKQIRLFVKEEGKYICKACFEVLDIIESDNDLSQVEEFITDTNFIKSRTDFNCLLKIAQVQTTDLPKDYLALRTGKSIYDVAFYGRNPNIWII